MRELINRTVNLVSEEIITVPQTADGRNNSTKLLSCFLLKLQEVHRARDKTSSFHLPMGFVANWECFFNFGEIFMSKCKPLLVCVKVCGLVGNCSR